MAPVTPSVEVIDGVAQVGASAGSNGAPEYGEWSVPWEDGFLVGSTFFPPQPLPDELPEEVRALFPQEVLDLFDGGLPATISEATTMLSDAGLLDVVSEIISNNPEAYDAIYGTPVAGRADARRSIHRRRHHVGTARDGAATGRNVLLRRRGRR